MSGSRLHALLAAALAACGGGSAGAPGSTVVGAAGATLRSDGLTLVIPAGALAHDVSLTVRHDDSAYETLDPFALQGTTFVIEPAATAFAVPATLSLSSAGVRLPLGLPDDRLRLHILAAEWQPVEGSAQAQDLVQGQIHTSGTYAARVWAPDGACAAPEFGGFSFWVGSWSIEDRSSNQSSDTIIALDRSGCYVTEDFVQGRYRGRSLSFYNPAAQLWYQTYRDSAHVREELSGTAGDGSMQMSGGTVNTSISNFVTWTRLDANHLRHLSQQRQGAGGGLTTSFDGLYTRAGAR
jgi:hypothetical protein